MYRAGQIIFQKEYYFQIVNQKVFEKISILSKKKYEKFHNQNKSAVVIYSLTFIFIIIDLLSFLICFNVGDISPQDEKERINDMKEDSKTWILILPLLTEWLITLGFYVYLIKRKMAIKDEIKKLINDRKNSIKCFTKERAKKFRKTLKLQEKTFSHNYFENFLFNVLLYIFPILLKLVLFKNLGFKVIFCIVAVVFYGYDIIFDLFKFFCKNRQKRKYNNELLNDEKNKNNYKSINVIVDNPNNSMNLNDDNNVSLGEIEININNMNENTIYERNKKMTSKYGEKSFDISFLIVKIILEILFIIYLTRIGEKFDDPNASCSWTILFIPFYLCLLPVLLFCVLHCLSLYRIFKDKVWLPILTALPCLLSLIVNCVIIPLKLDKKISLHESVIPIVFVIGTIFLIVHLLILKKYKKAER